jgi:hypothetical protein
MGLRCYDAEPEPEYSDYEYEPCMADYPGYLRRMYLLPRLRRLREERQLRNQQRHLRILPQTWNTKSGTSYHLPQRRETTIRTQKPTLTPMPQRCDEPDHIVRPIAARVAHDIERLAKLYETYTEVEIDEYIEEIDESFSMLSRLANRHKPRDPGNSGASHSGGGALNRLKCTTPKAP